MKEEEEKEEEEERKSDVNRRGRNDDPAGCNDEIDSTAGTSPKNEREKEFQDVLVNVSRFTSAGTMPISNVDILFRASPFFSPPLLILLSLHPLRR